MKGNKPVLRDRLNFAQKRCLALCGKLMQTTGMIGPGARIGIAVSGGVDSWVLLQTLHLRRSIVPFHFEIMALHVNPGFDPQNHAPLMEWLEREGVPGHIELSEHGPLAHSDVNRKRSACFLCAMLRRKTLFDLCAKYQLTHLAFGHNADDLASTFLMNLIQNGRVDGMKMKDDFFGGRLSVIRPLMLVDKNMIVKAARAWNLPVWKNTCPSAGATRRADMENELKSLYSLHPKARTNLLAGLCRWELDLTLAREKGKQTQTDLLNSAKSSPDI
ncbi:MAG: tRNA 2-thiocytidine biosynthesis protein TtcA [Desulfovibrionaceae bacterium]|nr:tRNA 2-thiocytidine biosynthesis protein TtcA [Desulfovibrionaceae bacterium]